MGAIRPGRSDGATPAAAGNHGPPGSALPLFMLRSSTGRQDSGEWRVSHRCQGFMPIEVRDKTGYTPSDW